MRVTLPWLRLVWWVGSGGVVRCGGIVFVNSSNGPALCESGGEGPE